MQSTDRLETCNEKWKLNKGTYSTCPLISSSTVEENPLMQDVHGGVEFVAKEKALRFTE